MNNEEMDKKLDEFVKEGQKDLLMEQIFLMKSEAAAYAIETYVGIMTLAGVSEIPNSEWLAYANEIKHMDYQKAKEK